MEITPQMEALISGFGPPATPAGPIEMGGWERTGKNIANLPGNVIEGLAQGFSTIGQLGTLPEYRSDPIDLPNFFDIPKPQSTSDIVSDFVVGKHGLADIMAQILLPAGAIGKLGKAAGMAEGVGLDMMRFGAGEAIAQAGIPEASTGGDIGVAGTVGGLQGALAYAPMRARLPLSALIAAGHGLYENERRGPLAGGITAGADFLAGLIGLPGRRGGAVAGELPPVRDPGNIPVGIRRRPLETGITTAEEPIEGIGDVFAGARSRQGPTDIFNAPPVVDTGVDVFGNVQTRAQPLTPETAAPVGAPLQGMPPTAKFVMGTDGGYGPQGTRLDPNSPVWAPGQVMLHPGTEAAPRARTSIGVEPPHRQPVKGPLDMDLHNAVEGEGDIIAMMQKRQKAEGQPPDPSATVPVEAPKPKRVKKTETEKEMGRVGKTVSKAQANWERIMAEGREMERQGADAATLEAHGEKIAKAKQNLQKAKGKWAELLKRDAQEKAAGAPPEATTPKTPLKTEPTPEPVPKLQEQVRWSPEERAYKQELTRRFDKYDESELREMVRDVDNEIANSPDEASARSYRLSREAAQDVLDARKPAIQEAATPTITTPAKAIKLRRGMVVGYADELGGMDRATVVSFDRNGMAKVKFEGTAQEVTVPQARLRENPPEAPVATLQKPRDVGDVESASVRESMEEVGEKHENVGVSEIERAQERGPGRRGVRQEPDDPHAARYATSEATGRELKQDFGTRVGKDLFGKLTQIMAEVVAKVNKNIKAGWVNYFPTNELAGNMEFGNILVSKAKMAEWFHGWGSMTPKQQQVTMARFSQLIGHETGHSALLWLRENDPVKFQKLINEFKNIDPEIRKAIIADLKHGLGETAENANIEYMAGTEFGMTQHYGIHPEAADNLALYGMEEFFADMFGAKVMGQLDETRLPKEIKGFWDTLKRAFRSFVALFTGEEFKPMVGADTESAKALQGFLSLMDEIGAQFRQVDGDAYKKSMRIGERIRQSEVDALAAQTKRLNARDLAKQKADDLAAAKYLSAKDRAEGKQEIKFDEDDIPEDAFDVGSYETVPPVRGASGGSPSGTLAAAFKRELIQELGSATAGAIIGGITGPDLTDGQLSMSEGILMGGVLGALGPRAIKALLAVPRSAGTTFHHKSFMNALVDVFKGNAEGVAADAATGHGSSVAKFLRKLERNFNLHLPQELFNAVVDAEGAAAWALHTVDDAFKKSKSYKPTTAFKAETEAFLRGAMDAPAYRGRIAGLGDAEANHAGNFYIAAREAIATLQTHFAAGLPDGTFKQMIMKSLADGSYLTRQFRLHHDPKYTPSPAQIENVARKYSSDHPLINLETSRSIVENYIHERKIAGADYRGSVTDVGKKFDSYLWNKRQTLDPVFRDMLGEYHDPREKVFGTIQHLYTSAVSGHVIDTVTKLKDKHGLNFSYGLDEHSAMINSLKDSLIHGRIPPGKTVATLQKELSVLSAYVPLDGNKRYGRLANKMVSRFVRDQLATFDSPWGLLDGSIMRSMAKFHNYVKIARAPLNPITVVRNIIAMPVLTVLGRANPLTDIPRAFRAIREGGVVMREMLENGIVGVDAVRGEMLRNVDYVRMLGIDNTITGLLQKGVNHALEFYRWPDMLVRGATYLRAKTKFAKELGLAESHADVIMKARDWTNRYTVNYANVAPMVKSLRQIPFTNLFISYTAEITRIAKNLVQDAFNHTDVGQRVFAASALGGLATLPFVFEKFSEMQLSEKDRADWQKAKRLMPAYQRTKHLVVMGREKDGRYRYFDMTPLVQVDAMTQMGRAIAAGDMEALKAVNPVIGWENTPAINIVSEQITGEDLRSGRPIDKNILTRAKAVLDDVVPPIIPGGYEYRRWTEALSRTEAGDLGTTNFRTGRRTTPGEIVASYLTGMRFGTVDANKLTQFAVADAKRKISNEQAYLKDVTQSNTTIRVQQKAMARFQEAQRNILLELTQRLQPD